VKKPSSWFDMSLLVLVAVAIGFWVANQLKTDRNAALTPDAPLVAKMPTLELPKEPFSEAEMAVYRQIILSYSTGDFVAAVKTVDGSLQDRKTSAEFRDWLVRQQPILLTNLAWVKIKSQDCDEAVKIFYRALAFTQVPEAQKGLGYCLRVIKNWPESASYLALYVLAKPSDIEGRLMYADTLESLGRYDEAVMILEGAAILSDVDAGLLVMAKERLTAMRAKAKSGSGQKTERSENFYVSYHEEAHDAILKRVLDILEAGVGEYSSLLGVTPPANPIEVILYRKEDFFDVVPGGPGWAEGVFDGRMRVPVSTEMLQDVEGRLAVVLRHELSHAILSDRAGGRAWPTWFDEGLAQYLSCRARACEAFRFPAKLSEFSSVMRLTNPFVTLDDVHAGSAYLHSLYLIQVLIRQKGEGALDFISNRVPAAGPLSSDFIAETSGWSSFEEMWKDAERRWKQRLAP
jgi:tetratricopeptide (TPR) repeat protein